MNMYQETVESAIKEALLPHKVLTRLVRKKFQALGIELSTEQINKVELQLETLTQKQELEESDTGSTTYFDLDLDETVRSDIHIKLGDWDEIEEEIQEVLTKISTAIPEISNSIADSVLDTLRDDSARMLDEHEKIRIGFEDRLKQTWDEPLKLFKMLMVVALEAGEEFNSTYRATAVQQNDITFEVLTRLHAKACQVASEVYSLLSSGHGDGAYARWRTLHETSVIASFIKSHGNEVAERYLLHDTVESYKAILQYKQYANRLGLEPVTSEEFSEIESAYQQLIKQFGPNYKHSYGWAAEALGKKKPNFSDIEKDVEFDHWRPYYKLASHGVHANPKGLHFKLGSFNDTSGILLAGPSDIGLADPGHGVAISLMQTTVTLLLHAPNIDRLVMCSVLMKLADETGESFLAVHDSMAEADEKGREIS